jgi:dienelactone hydrolase
MAEPTFLQPFVLPYDAVAPTHADGLDLYLPTQVPAPAIVLVHGGPVPAHVDVRPPSWPAFGGYGSLAAHVGAVGVMFEHGYTAWDEVDRASEDVVAAVDRARRHPSVDPDRVLLWFFSGGGVLAGRWLADPPEWLAGVALTYPMLSHVEEIASDLVSPLDAVRERVDLPLLLTRVEQEYDWIASSQAAFLAAAEASSTRVDVIDVPGAQHGFETIDDTDAARAAITEALAWARATLA